MNDQILDEVLGEIRELMEGYFKDRLSAKMPQPVEAPQEEPPVDESAPSVPSEEGDSAEDLARLEQLYSELKD